MTNEPEQIDIIDSYHAHIYYDPATKANAAKLRQWVEQRFQVRMGNWHDVPVGPHPQAMFQILFGAELFPTLVPFLMLNRLGLTVLVHPETGRPRDDHLQNPLWLGAVLKLNTDILPEISTD